MSRGKNLRSRRGKWGKIIYPKRMLKKLKNLSAADVERLKKLVEKMKNAKLVKRTNSGKK